jgi:hypothetical protein
MCCRNVLLPFSGLKGKPRNRQATCLAYSLTLKMEAVFSVKMPVNFCQAAWSHIPEDITLLLFFCSMNEYLVAALYIYTVTPRVSK